MNNIPKYLIKQYYLNRFGPDISFESIISRNPALISFDVFDTTITRAVGTSIGSFEFMRQQLARNRLDLPDSLINGFPRIRKQAADITRKNSPSQEIILDEIYAWIVQQYSLHQNQGKALMDLELQTEYALCNPVPKICDLIGKLREHGLQICFTSDTYLPAARVQRLLEKVGAFDQRDRIFVSSAFRLNKKSGDLFRKILTATGLEPKDILHIGDNMKGDYTAPSKLGIHSFFFQNTHLTRYESTYLDKINDHFQAQLVSGAARLSRLQSAESGRQERELFTLGSNLAGPILVQYVLWILEQARNQGLKRLYFFSRDGQILLQIAQRLQDFLNSDLELQYLYVSRQALNLPSVLRQNQDEATWLFEKMDGLLTARIMANRLNAELDTAQAGVGQILHREVGPDQQLDNGDIERIRNSLFQSELGAILENRAKTSRQAMLSYFRQEGLNEPTPSGVVDLGWKGSIQDLISKILQSENVETQLTGFYLGLHADDYNSAQDKQYFLYSKQKTNHFDRLKRFQFIMELLCSADHQTVLTYALNNGYGKPVLKSGSCNWLFDWGLASLRQGIFSYLEIFSRNEWILEARPDPVSCKQAFIQNIMSLIFHPSPEEASTLGQYLYTADTSETYLRELAPQFDLKTARQFSFSNWQDKRKHTFWHEGSFYRSPPLVKLLLLLTSVEIQKSLLFRIKNYTGSPGIIFDK